MGQREKTSRPSSPSKFNIKDRSKLVLSTFGISLLSFLSYYLTKNASNSEQSSGIIVKLGDDDIDENWIKGLHNYFVKQVDTPTNNWNNRTYTKNIGHCHATCNDTSNNIDISYDTSCQTFPVFIYDRIVTPELLSKMTYAEATMPCFLKLAESRIPKAGRGIFTTKYKIPRGFIFGPYYGIIKSGYGAEGDEARDGGYAWRVIRWDQEDADFHIDGIDENKSNWLRYVNTARYAEEQNVFPLQFNDTVYYMTVKDVEPDTELLVWYGYGYARWLEIYVIPTSQHDWDKDWAPPVNETICPTCPVTEGERRIEYDDEDEEEAKPSVNEEDKKNIQLTNTNKERSDDDDDDNDDSGGDLDGSVRINDPFS